MESRVLLLVVALFLPYSLCARRDYDFDLTTQVRQKRTGPLKEYTREEEQKLRWVHHRTKTIKNETRCYEPIGCLTTTKEWYSPLRPFNPFPVSREAVGTQFKLYTRDNREGEMLKVDDNEEVQSQHFQSYRDSIFIIHGHNEKGTEEHYTRILDALLQRMDANVVIVDWAKGAAEIYFKATSNTRLAGLEIAYLINTLIKKKGASPGKFHLIGHSLGSHVAGYAGEKIENLGRITGLDPAGPYFRTMPSFVRIDPTDAVLVDIIRTDMELGFGASDTVLGHLEFYPNGARHQPGCLPNITAETLLGFTLCCHQRSVALFWESILSSPFYEDGNDEKCPFTSFGCDSYKDFLNGKCTSCGKDGLNCALMGMDADKYPGLGNPEMKRKKFFLKTNPELPYCGYHYNVNLQLPSEFDAQDRVAGHLNLTAMGEKATAKDMPITMNGARTFSKGEAYSLLGFSSVQAGKVSTAGVKWEWNPNLLVNRCISCKSDLHLADVSVTNMGYYPQEGFKTSETCQSREPAKIENGGQYNFQLSC